MHVVQTRAAVGRVVYTHHAVLHYFNRSISTYMSGIFLALYGPLTVRKYQREESSHKSPKHKQREIQFGATCARFQQRAHLFTLVFSCSPKENRKKIPCTESILIMVKSRPNCKHIYNVRDIKELAGEREKI